MKRIIYLLILITTFVVYAASTRIIEGDQIRTSDRTKTFTLPATTGTLSTLGGTETLTNKTLMSPVINTPTGIVKGDVGLGNVDNTSDATKNAASVTLTNKTMSGSSNTFTNISLATAVTGTLDVAFGGTGNNVLSVANGGVIYTDGSKLMNTGVGTSGRYLKSNGAAAPTWTQVDLTAGVTGALPVANGGTNNASLAVTAGGTLYTDGSKIVNVGAGTSGQYLKSNGSSAPSWANGSVTNSVSAKTGNYTLTTSDYLVTLDNTGGPFTLTLPTAVGITGQVFVLKRIDQTLGTPANVATTSSQTIDGETTTYLMTQYETLTVISDGANWRTLNRDYPKKWIAYSPAYNGLGVVSDEGTFWRRNGDCIDIVSTGATGTVSAAVLQITIPSGLAMDSTKMSSTTNANSFGVFYNITSASGNPSSGAGPMIVHVDTAVSTINMYVSRTNSAARFAKDNGNAVIGSSERFRLEVRCIPIDKWR